MGDFTVRRISLASPKKGPARILSPDRGRPICCPLPPQNDAVCDTDAVTVGFRTSQHKRVGFFLIPKWFVDVNVPDSPPRSSLSSSYGSLLGGSFQNSINLRVFLLAFQTKPIPETVLAEPELFISLKPGRRRGSLRLDVGIIAGLGKKLQFASGPSVGFIKLQESGFVVSSVKFDIDGGL